MNLNLSQRESEVVLHLVKGKTVKEIASKLFISTRTAETHIKNAKAKAKAGNLAHLAAKYVLSLGKDARQIVAMVFLGITTWLVAPSTDFDLRRTRIVKNKVRVVRIKKEA